MIASENSNAGAIYTSKINASEETSSGTSSSCQEGNSEVKVVVSRASSVDVFMDGESDTLPRATEPGAPE